MNKKKVLQLIMTASVFAGGMSLTKEKVQAIPVDNNTNSIDITSDVRSIQKGKVVNVTSNLRVRSGADTNSNVIGYLNNGIIVDIVGESGNWYKINFNGRHGYVSKDYISRDNNSNSNSNNSNTSYQKGKVINVSTSLTIRQSASTSSAVLGALHNGDVFDIISKSGQWYNIKTGGIVGFVHGDYVQVISSGGSQETTPSERPSETPTSANGKVVNVSSNLRVRSSASTSSSTLGYLINGQSVNITGETGNWYKIDFNGSTGYVFKDYIERTSGNGSSSNGQDNEGSNNNNNNSATEVVKGYVVNISSSLNVRSGASTSFDVLGVLYNREEVDIVGESGNWYIIKFNGSRGYVSKDYISKSKPETTPEVKPEKPNKPNEGDSSGSVINKMGQVYNVSSNLRVRSEASIDSMVLGYLMDGETVQITGANGNWYKIIFKGKPGYVSKDYIKIVESNTVNPQGTYEAVLGAMKAHLGSPYVWGGSGEYLTTSLLDRLKTMYPSQTNKGAYVRAERYANKGYRAFDCSGLMQWGFRQAGINIGRSTWDQIGDGVEVSLKNVKPGDLLFYSNLEHVGMYVGNGQWIEAPNKDADVRIVNVPWSRIGRARRVLN